MQICKIFDATTVIFTLILGFIEVGGKYQNGEQGNKTYTCRYSFSYHSFIYG